MDTITQEDYSTNTEGELTSPFPPKRPRTDCTHSNDGKSSFAFPELVTFWKTIGSSSSTSTWRGNAGLVCLAESGDMEDGKTHEQLQDPQFIVIPITSTTSYTGMSDVSLISAERCFKLLVRDEQLPIAPTDKLTSIVLDDEDSALAETCTLKEGNADTSRPPDSKLQGKALEDEALGNNKAGALVQNSASQIQGLQVSAREYGLSDQSGCTSENPLHDTQGQSAEAEESNQEWQEPGLRETFLFSEEEDNSLISFTHADTDSFFSDPQPSGNPGQICENVAICNLETKNENGISMNSIPSAALCAEGSIVSYGVVSVDVPIETVILDADDFCGAKGEDAAGKMIAQAQSKTSDHTTGTPMLAQIHQVPAEGDNDASPFTVIEPAIWSETDGEGKEKSCHSGSAAEGVQLLSSVCNMETSLPFCSDIRLSQEVLTRNQNGKSDHQRRTQQGKDGKEDLWQSFTEPQACTINTNETHNNSGSDNSCHWKTSPSSRPAKPPPAGDGRQVSHDTVGHQLKDQMKTKEVRCIQVEYLKAEIGRTNQATTIKQNGGMTGFEEEIITGEQPENSQDFEQKRLQQNEKRTEEANKTSTGNSISDRTEGKTSKYGNKLTHVDDVLINKLGFLFDHPYNALVLTTEAGEKERKEEASVGAESDMYGNSDIVVEWEVVHQQQSEQNKDIPEEWISECTEGHKSKSAHNLTLGSRCEQEQLVQLSCLSDFQHIAETNVVDNRDDPRTLTAFPFNGRMPGGIDTFQRIQLSLDGDEDGLSKSPLLTGLPGQLLTSPQQQLHEHEEVPQEEEEETSGHHTENKAKGFSGIYSTCNEVPNCISAAAGDIAPVRPKTHNSPECFQEDFTAQSVLPSVRSNSGGSGSDVDDCLKFEKKELFDKVLKELNLFFDISISDFTRDSGASSSEQCVHVTEALDRNILNSKEDLSIPELGCYRDPSPDDVEEDCGLEMCAGDADVSPACEGEQEVPLGTHLCTKETHKEPPQRKRWSPSFLGPPLLEQLGYRQPEQTRRLQPLRTCTRPIRVGLSKRAKTKQLHHPPHPSPPYQ